MLLAADPAALSFRKLSIVYGLHSLPVHLGNHTSPIQPSL